MEIEKALAIMRNLNAGKYSSDRFVVKTGQKRENYFVNICDKQQLSEVQFTTWPDRYTSVRYDVSNKCVDIGEFDVLELYDYVMIYAHNKNAKHESN